jgi:hypothetical protein
MPSCTSIRLAQTQVWPAFQYLAAIAPLNLDIGVVKHDERRVAAQSSDSFLTVPTHCCISNLPVSVEPMKLILAADLGEVAIVQNHPIAFRIQVRSGFTLLGDEDRFAC